MLKAKRSRGIALIEVLVSVLLLAVGIVGVIGLQSRMVQASTENRLRATATLLAGEVLGTMWVAVPASTDYSSYSIESGTSLATRITTSLPAGTASVSAVGQTVTVAISWRMPTDEARHSITQTAVITTGNEPLVP
ncbi:MAG: hypothetical protein Q7T87_16595 [Polaromonas sp.]|nr:hypothetical protein [Polaromonas sp.]